MREGADTFKTERMSHRFILLKEHFTKVITPSLTGKVRGGSVLLFLLFNLISCDTYNCLLETNVACTYGFYATQRDDSGALVTGAAVAVGDTLTITALGIDTVLANRLVGQSGVSLPVSYYGDVDSLLFTFSGDDGIGRDTLYLHKENTAHLDDPSCPAHMWHRITAVHTTHHLIDTVLITEPQINYDGLENLQIYFRTAQE